MKIGNISIDCTQHFSRQQKEHWKEYFGIIIEDTPNTNILFSATVKVHWLNVRSGAGINYGKVSVLKYNDEVKIIQKQNRVYFDRVIGGYHCFFISSDNSQLYLC